MKYHFTIAHILDSAHRKDLFSRKSDQMTRHRHEEIEKIQKELDTFRRFKHPPPQAAMRIINRLTQIEDIEDGHL